MDKGHQSRQGVYIEHEFTLIRKQSREDILQQIAYELYIAVIFPERSFGTKTNEHFRSWDELPLSCIRTSDDIVQSLTSKEKKRIVSMVRKMKKEDFYGNLLKGTVRKTDESPQKALSFECIVNAMRERGLARWATCLALILLLLAILAGAYALLM